MKNSNNTNSNKKLMSCIKPIINGIYYERRNMYANMSGGYSGNMTDYVVHVDNSSMLKSGIRTILIENERVMR